ncbi:MAG: diguanylate cyclase [Tepidiformaceae bacterium]
MSVTRFPAYLRIIGANASFEPQRREPTPIRNLQLDVPTGVATRDALIERVKAIGEIAPSAPLSFLVAKVSGLASGECDDQLRVIAGRIKELVRGVDVVGRLDETSFGIALQGSGFTAAGAVAARITHHLNRLAELSPSVCITVSAATGTGVNAETLPLAALDPYEPCCG